MSSATATWAMHYLRVARDSGFMPDDQFNNRTHSVQAAEETMNAPVTAITDITGKRVLDYIDPLAAEAIAKAENMTGTQLDDWYEEHVGYRPTDEEPGLSPQMHAAQVACVMYLHSLPQGLDDPLYSDQAEVMIHAYFGIKPQNARA